LTPPFPFSIQELSELPTHRHYHHHLSQLSHRNHLHHHHHLYFIFCVYYLCLIGRVYVFYVGHVDKSSLYETLFHCNILSKHHNYHISKFSKVIKSLFIIVPVYIISPIIH
jgi:hypothetical protein